MNQRLQQADFALIMEAETQVAASLDAAYAAATDTGFFEDLARSHGLAVSRRGSEWPDLAWDINGPIGGRQRTLDVAIVTTTPPVRIVATARLGAVMARSEMQFFETSRRRARLHLRVGLAGTSVAGRLLVQSMRLSRPRLNRKLTRALSRFSRLIARRARETGP